MVTVTESCPPFTGKIKMENMIEIKKQDAKPGKYYLLETAMWSASGYAIAEFDGEDFICEASGRAVTTDIETIYELTTPTGE